VEAVKLTIGFPLSQQSLTFDNVVTFLNQELQLNAVPTLISEHAEYLVFKTIVPLVNGISRYPIPDRAIGMTLRDLKFSDTNGNYYDITRVAPDDKAFFQLSNSSNQTVGKFYLEGNEIVLTPQILAGATGNLNMFFYLRPNHLVRDDRAAIIETFHKHIVISDNSAISAGDTITITVGVQTPSPTSNTFFAVNSSAQTIVSNSIAEQTEITCTNNHDIPYSPDATSFTVTISGVTGSVPSINGTYTATSTGPNTFTIPVQVTTAGTGGSYSIENQFQIGGTANITATNLNTAINAAGISSISSLVTTNTVGVNYEQLSDTFEVSNDTAFTVDNETVIIKFDNLATSYTDPETDEVSTLFEAGGYVDFLQTNPGHRTYTYDVELLEIDGNYGTFDAEALKTYLSNSSGGTKQFLQIKIGDYICLQNECIIPQIPPELHHALAERAASRVLMAIGDREGYAVTAAKIAEMDKKQETLIGSRVESSVPKVFNRNSILRTGKSRFRRRY